MSLQTNRSFNQKSQDEFIIEHSCTNLGFLIVNLMEDIKSLATERNTPDNGTNKNFKNSLELSKEIRFRKNLFSQLKTRMQNLSLDWHAIMEELKPIEAEVLDLSYPDESILEAIFGMFRQSKGSNVQAKAEEWSSKQVVLWNCENSGLELDDRNQTSSYEEIALIISTKQNKRNFWKPRTIKNLMPKPISIKTICSLKCFNTRLKPLFRRSWKKSSASSYGVSSFCITRWFHFETTFRNPQTIRNFNQRWKSAIPIESSRKNSGRSIEALVGEIKSVVTEKTTGSYERYKNFRVFWSFRQSGL